MQRRGSRTVHRIACRIRDGQRAAAKYQEDSHGIPDGAHTHGSGGGLGAALLVVVGAALAVKLAGPVVAAAAELVYVLVIVVAVIAGVGDVGVVGVLLWRWRHPRPVPRWEVTARQLPPQPRRSRRPRRCTCTTIGMAPPPNRSPLFCATRRHAMSDIDQRMRRRWGTILLALLTAALIAAAAAYEILAGTADAG